MSPIICCSSDKEHRIPILGAIGPRAHWKWEWSRLRKVYDEGRDTNDINHCYHCRTLGTDGSRLTFIIHPAKVTSVRILGRGDSKTTIVFFESHQVSLSKLFKRLRCSNVFDTRNEHRFFYHHQTKIVKRGHNEVFVSVF